MQSERPYLGPTVLSDMVIHKVFDISLEISALLSDAAEWQTWEPVWTYTRTQKQKDQGHELIVSLVLNLACSWHVRFVCRVSEFPLLLLWFAEAMPQVNCPRRLQVAKLMLETSDEELDLDPFSDLALKTKQNYNRELQLVIETSGQCPHALYQYSLLLRSQMPAETQDIEGNNSVLSAMSKIAPNLHIALATTRLSIKKGKRVTASQCVAMHNEVQQFLQSETNAGRFVPLCDSSGATTATAGTTKGQAVGAALVGATTTAASVVEVVPPSLPKLPHPKYTETQKIAARWALAAYRCAEIGAGWLSSIDGTDFIMGWTYTFSVFVVAAKRSEVSASQFHLVLPLVVRKLYDVLLEVSDFGQAPASSDNRKRAPKPTRTATITLFQTPVSCLNSLNLCTLDLANQQKFELEAKLREKRLAKKHKPQDLYALADAGAERDAASSSSNRVGAYDAANADADGSEDEDEDFLIQALERVMEEEVGLVEGAEALISETIDWDDNDDEQASDGPKQMAEDSGDSERTDAGVMGAEAIKHLQSISEAVCKQLRKDVVSVSKTKALEIQEAWKIAQQDAKGIADKTLALVQQDGDVCFVRWDSAKQQTGWRIFLDDKERIKYRIPMKKDVESFAHAEIIISTLLVFMWKDTGRGRDTMPWWAVLIRDLRQAKIFAGPHSAEALQLGCVVCEAASREGISVPRDHEELDVFRCFECLTSWHKVCAKAFVALLSRSRSAREQHAGAEQQSFIETCFTCPVCTSRY